MIVPKKDTEEGEKRRSQSFNIAAWTPKTKLGEMVKAGKITSLEQIFAMGKPIKEVEIVDALLPLSKQGA